MLAIIAIGLVALPGLNKETFPKVELYQVQVSVAYPGASPSDVEEGICNPLEDATDGISFTKEQRCEARDNIGMLTMEMQESGEMRQFIDDIKSAVDGITDFPANSEDPVVTELGRTDSVVTLPDLIKSQALELPAGVLESKDTSYQIRFDNARKTADELASLVILNTDKGGEIRLGDIATIEDQFESKEERVELDG
ncbi:Multidrug resistance protein MdtB [Nymphon striatum]|nr:Multidrug resistance protein MdtB [Nymphon striatum]